MRDYTNLTEEELYQLIALKNNGVIKFIYDKYAAAIYGLILKSVSDPKDAGDILCRTFVLLIKTKPNPLQTLPHIFIRLHNIASGIINKTGLLYPLRSEINIRASHILS